MRELLSLNKEILGEACGIFAGDGSLYSTKRSYVLEVRSNEKELYYYVHYVKPIFEKLFLKNLKIIKRSYPGGYVIGIRVCGKEAARIFNALLEFPIGRKSHRVKIPQVILNNSEYWKPYARGIFDTDGSVYLRTTGRKYKNPVIDIASRSIEHLLQLKEIMRDLGFYMWLEKSNFKIRMAGWKNMERFFKDINPHNNTKVEKYEKMIATRNKLM